MYIFLSELHVEEEQEYKNYLRITPECFDGLFVLMRGSIIKQIANIGDASSPKLRLAANMFHIHSFVILF